MPEDDRRGFLGSELIDKRSTSARDYRRSMALCPHRCAQGPVHGSGRPQSGPPGSGCKRSSRRVTPVSSPGSHRHRRNTRLCRRIPGVLQNLQELGIPARVNRCHQGSLWARSALAAACCHLRRAMEAGGAVRAGVGEVSRSEGGVQPGGTTWRWLGVRRLQRPVHYCHKTRHHFVTMTDISLPVTKAVSESYVTYEIQNRHFAKCKEIMGCAMLGRFLFSF